MNTSDIITVTVGEGSRYEITACAIPCGRDWSVTVCGGTLHHVGAVSASCPDEWNNTWDSVLLPTHRDDRVSRMFARRISEALHCNAGAAAGIHIDNASAEEIALLVKNCEECCSLLIEKIISRG